MYMLISMINKNAGVHTVGANKKLTKAPFGTVTIRSWCGPGAVVVRSGYGRGLVQVQSWFGNGAGSTA